MKKIKIILLVLLSLSVINFVACSQSSSSGDRNSDGSSSPIATSDSGTDTGTGTGTDVTNNPVITYIGSKSPSVAKEVGDIVFNDGSATPYSVFKKYDEEIKNEKKKNAIAVIFYKGNLLNNDINGIPDTETIRTLGVGLIHSKEMLALMRGDYPNPSDAANCYKMDMGALYNGKNGSNMFEKISEFLKNAENVEDDTNLPEKYPAFAFCKNYKDVEGARVKDTMYENGWYIPTYEELEQIWQFVKVDEKILDFDEVSEMLDGDKFLDDQHYRTSSMYLQFGRTHGRVITWDTFGWVTTTEEDGCMRGSICAIHEFN